MAAELQSGVNSASCLGHVNLLLCGVKRNCFSITASRLRRLRVVIAHSRTPAKPALLNPANGSFGADDRSLIGSTPAGGHSKVIATKLPFAT
jgi:hypothetical protein